MCNLELNLTQKTEQNKGSFRGFFSLPLNSAVLSGWQQKQSPKEIYLLWFIQKGEKCISKDVFITRKDSSVAKLYFAFVAFFFVKGLAHKKMGEEKKNVGCSLEQV